MFFFFFDPSFVPTKPFDEFKWLWACLQCTEGINDPVVLLGVLFRMRKLELTGKHLAYSSEEFAKELRELAADIDGRGIGVDLARRTGNRNLIRNSGQYWRGLGLIPTDNHGQIVLTDFGRQVADRKISKAEFAAITVATFTLPNPAIQKPEIVKKWNDAGLRFRPLALLLQILRVLAQAGESEAYLTKDELIKIIIPLSGTKDVTPEIYADYIQHFRHDHLDISAWPNCCPEANDHRIAREFLLFLANYGYLSQEKALDSAGREVEVFRYNSSIDGEIAGILEMANDEKTAAVIETAKTSTSVIDMERKRIEALRSRPNQAKFRREVLDAMPCCVITNISLPNVLEAAHIIPYKYHGEDTAANGFSMRMDIHEMFDSDQLRINDKGDVSLTDRARMSYGELIPRRIVIPSCVNLDFVRWRWDNYHGY